MTFDIDQMLAEAVTHAGVDDLGRTDGFDERLHAHVAAIEADTGLRQLSRNTLRSRIVRLLRNQLSLTDLLKRYPEDHGDPDRETDHRGRHAAFGHHAPGEPARRGSAPARCRTGSQGPVNPRRGPRPVRRRSPLRAGPQRARADGQLTAGGRHA